MTTAATPRPRPSRAPAPSAALRRRQAAIVERCCRLIESAEAPPTLAALARAVGLSAWHLQRVFTSITGVSPKAYADARRGDRVRAGLSSATSVTAAIYGAGFNASSRFYQASDAILGMTPTAFRAGGADQVIRFAVGECSLGAILVAASAKGVCAILLGDDPDALARDLQDRFPRATLIGDDARFDALVATVVGAVEAPAAATDLPLDIRGTAFQQRVWQALRRIPAGETISYTQLARRVGAPRAVRAVAGACAANAVAVLIPCHRVVRTDGSLSGYRWGVERKRALIAREATARGAR
ncbi:MAG TPA: bifunctional DNA-binding transcriptional regulator/O6-methylguanine-DNA methyltransferase Ada [Planctomycetota bacterium]|nr:bifunctional DNA-binding transcriptional regulator/O6-methylguanine-DNA methyltransferase Ada [Planctomycetota bacterium]